MKNILTIPTILIGFSFNALAQNMPPGGPPPDPVAMALDGDHDHGLSKREIRNAARSLEKLDGDGDGALSAEELRPEPPEGRRRPKKDEGNNADPLPAPPPSELLSAIDTDSNGSLSKEELEAAPESLAKLDTDADGELNNQEVPSLGDPDDDGSGRLPAVAVAVDFRRILPVAAEALHPGSSFTRKCQKRRAVREGRPSDFFGTTPF